MQKFIEPTYPVSDIVQIVNDLLEDSLQPVITRDKVIRSINRLAQFEEEMNEGSEQAPAPPPTRRRGRKPGSKNKPKTPPADDSDLFECAPAEGAEAATSEDGSEE